MRGAGRVCTRRHLTVATTLKEARPSTRRVTGQSSSAYPGEMSRPGAKTEPDLFTLPRRKIEPAPLPSRPVLLPDDLVCSLRLLADAELERLQAAVVNEVARRGPPTPPLGRASDPSDERERRVRNISSPQTGESRGYCREGQRHPSGLPGRAEAGHHRPSVRRTAVRRPTSPAGGGQVVAALTMAGVAIGMSISRLDRTAATLQAERARAYQRRLRTPAVPRSR